MQIPLYGPHSLAPIGEVSRRKATSLLLNREATRLLDKHRVEIGIRMKPAAIVEVSPTCITHDEVERAIDARGKAAQSRTDADRAAMNKYHWWPLVGTLAVRHAQ